MKKKIIAIVFLLFMFSNSNAVQFSGGHGLFFTQSPLTYETGQLSMNVYTRGFMQSDPKITHGTMAMTAEFGFSNRFEMGLSLIGYQTVHFGSDPAAQGANMVPGNTRFRAKWGGFNFNIGEKTIFYAFSSMVDYRTGKQYNMYLEPYQDYAISGRIDAYFGYFLHPMSMGESPAVFFNIGYINYNDAETITSSAQGLPIAIGYTLPNIKKAYSVELHGDFFLKRPVESKFSRENYLYLTPGYKYNMYLGLSFGFSLDLLVYTEKEKSNMNLGSGFPQYPPWRLNFKLGFTPSTAFYQIPTFEKPTKETTRQYSGAPSSKGFQTLSARRTITDKKSLFEWVVDENQGAQYIDLELEKIREERKRAEKELLKLKNEIEEVSKGK